MEQYSKKCPNPKCENIITYKSIWDKLRGIEKNTTCNSCRNYIRNEKLLEVLKKTNLSYNEISINYCVSIHILKHLVNKYKIKRDISVECSTQRSLNFRKNVLDKNLNIYGGSNKDSYHKIFKKRYGYDYSIFLDRQPEFKKYYNEVRNITLKNLRKYRKLFYNLDKLGRCGNIGKYQVDHNFSIKRGFESNITPHLIAHPSNLRVIRWEDNLRKSDNCYITIDELINNAAIFLTNNHKIELNDF